MPHLTISRAADRVRRSSCRSPRARDAVTLIEEQADGRWRAGVVADPGPRVPARPSLRQREVHRRRVVERVEERLRVLRRRRRCSRTRTPCRRRSARPPPPAARAAGRRHRARSAAAGSVFGTVSVIVPVSWSTVPGERLVARVDDALLALRVRRADARRAAGRVVVPAEREALHRVPADARGRVLVAVREPPDPQERLAARVGERLRERGRRQARDLQRDREAAGRRVRADRRRS